MTTSVADINTRPIALDVLLTGIDDGSVVLPDFQRDFDWNSGEIVSLLATLLRGWPAGSLLLMKGRPKFFATRAFESAPRQSGDVEYVVLDGQQRLTALYLALRGQGSNRYALAYDDQLVRNQHVGAEEIEDRIRIIPTTKWSEEYDLRRQAAEGLVPLTALSSASDFYEWREDVVRQRSPEDRDAFAHDLSRLYRGLLGSVNHYDFPCVVLENDLPSEAVARIFERINKSGRRLNTFDLMVARAYAPDWNLRERWEAVAREFENIDAFLGDDGLPLLQTVALHDFSDVRQPAVLQLSPERVHEAWDQAVLAMDHAIDFVLSIGVVRPDYLPYKAQLLTLSGLAWDRDLTQGRRVLEQWFWSSSIAGAYDVGSSTRVVSDLRALRTALDGEAELDVPAVAFDSLVTSTRRQNPALWRTTMALLSRAGPVDLLSGDDVGQETDSRSVPVSVFKPVSSGAEPLHHRIFGMVKATRATARQARQAPLLSIAAELVDAALADRLASQLLPPTSVRLALDPETLIRERIELVLEFVRSTIGHECVQVQRTSEA